MAACTPTPTQTIFTTSTFSTISISTSISNEVDTSTSTSTFTTTRCDAFNTTAGADPTCLSSTVVTSTSLVDVLTTIPHTSSITVPVFVTQTPAIQTLWSTCPDQPNPPQNTNTPSQTPDPDPISSSTGEQSTIVVTSYSTYTDSNGIHTASSTVTTTNPALNPTGDNNKSGPALSSIIGGVVGGVLGLIAIIALIWYLLWRREQTRFSFDDDEDDGQGGKGVHATGLLARDGGRRGRTRSVNLEDEIKNSDVHPYQYGMVGGSPSPSGSPAMHSQNSTMGYGGHQRSSSRDALMSGAPGSPSVSPRHLDVLLPMGQRRASQLTGSSGAPESIMMTNQQPMGHATNYNLGNRPSDERDAPWMGHQARPSSSLLEAPASYPPGHGGFYQQYGPIDQVQPVQQTPPATGNGGGGVHRPPLDPGLASATRPVPAHQALYHAAGLSDPNSPLTHSNTTSTSRTQGQSPALASPPPGAAGARQYPISAATAAPVSTTLPSPPQNRESDLFSAVMASADHAAATATSQPSNVGFGRQRRDGEKSPTPSAGPRSPVIQHRDGGRALPEQSGQPTTQGGEVPPPAYSDP